MPESFTKSLAVPVALGLILPEPLWCRRQNTLLKTSWPSRKQPKNLPALKMRTNAHAASPSRQNRNLKRLHLKGSFLGDRKSTRLNSSHVAISYAVFCL